MVGKDIAENLKVQAGPQHGQIQGYKEKRGQSPGSNLCKRWGEPASTIPSCPTFLSRRQGLVPISWPLKDGFMSAPKCLILCFQYTHHTTYLWPFCGKEPGFPPARLRHSLMPPGRSPAKKKNGWQ